MRVSLKGGAYAGYVACQYSSSLSFRIGRRAGSLSKAFQPRRTVHQLRFVSGGWDVDYGLPRARADSDRPRYEPNRIGSHCFKLCGDRPRDRLVPVGLRRRHRKSASRILMALVTTMNTGPRPALPVSLECHPKDPEDHWLKRFSACPMMPTRRGVWLRRLHHEAGVKVPSLPRTGSSVGRAQD